MSAFPPPIPPLPSLWQEARAPDGRIYYYNTQTKATQWTKPAELMSPAEVLARPAVPFMTDPNLEISDAIGLEGIHYPRGSQVLAQCRN
jgi:hypothetical protein